MSKTGFSPLSISLSNTHTHTHARTHTLSTFHIHADALTNTFSLFFTLAYTQTHIHTHTRTHFLSLSLFLTFSLWLTQWWMKRNSRPDIELQKWICQRHEPRFLILHNFCKNKSSSCFSQTWIEWKAVQTCSFLKWRFHKLVISQTGDFPNWWFPKLAISQTGNFPN